MLPASYPAVTDWAVTDWAAPSRSAASPTSEAAADAICCDRVRDAEKRAAGETVQPTKDFCANGHPMDGDNLGFRSNGYARCRACSLADTKEWQAENRDEYLESRRDARREEKVEADAYFAARIREIYYDPTLDDDALIEALRNVLK